LKKFPASNAIKSLFPGAFRERGKKQLVAAGIPGKGLGATPEERARLDRLLLDEVAKKRADPDKLLKLLDAGANPSATDEDGLTPLHIAVDKSNPGAIDVLMSHGADHTMLSPRFHATPLQEAALWGTAKCVDRLLSGGADPKVKDQMQRSLLHLAAKSRSPEVVGKILSLRKVGVDDVDLDGNTAFHTAARDGEFEVAKLLLDHGADVNKKTKDGSTALSLAKDNQVAALIYLHAFNKNIRLDRNVQVKKML